MSRVAAALGAARRLDAVEIDDLDRYSRPGGRIAEDDAVAFLALLASAHAHGLAIGQKNSAELVPNLSIVLRDLALRPRGASGYVFDGC